MAKINNQAVLQKLIDELKLYPAKDSIPTELAEKILPVFQINSDEIVVEMPKANVIKTVIAGGSTSTAIYTVPATGNFYLTNVALQAGHITNALALQSHISATPKDGSAEEMIGLYVRGGTGAAVDGVHEANSLNFQNPILLEPGSAISFELSNSGGQGSATIVGYTE